MKNKTCKKYTALSFIINFVFYINNTIKINFMRNNK